MALPRVVGFMICIATCRVSSVGVESKGYVDMYVSMHANDEVDQNTTAETGPTFFRTLEYKMHKVFWFKNMLAVATRSKKSPDCW